MFSVSYRRNNKWKNCQTTKRQLHIVQNSCWYTFCTHSRIWNDVGKDSSEVNWERGINQCWLPKFKPVNHAENTKPILHAFFFKLLSRDSEVLDPESGKVNDDRLPSLIYKYTTIVLESFEVIISPKYHLFQNSILLMHLERNTCEATVKQQRHLITGNLVFFFFFLFMEWFG